MKGVLAVDIKTFTTCRLIKGEDLNHHGTLFAGRTAEWFVESGFIAAASITNPENIVCLKIHGMTFRRPVHKGELIRLDSKIVFAGHTRLVAYVTISDANGENPVVDGFITFVHVDLDGRPLPHNISINAVTPQDRELQAKAKTL